MTHTDSKPWFRQFWPWFLIAIPLSSVIMGVVMINLAVGGKDSLVRKDWYKDGLAINQRLDKQQKARDLGIQASLTLDSDSRELFVDTRNLDTRQASELTLHFFHPTLEQKDHVVQLYKAPGDRFYTRLDFQPQGLYYLLLTAPGQDWEIESRINFSNPIRQQALTPHS
ncbi:MAG: FixH family protein [Pseudomonadota bacterium]|nr:FixH family protein [Pseudomonadota bacterium]